MPMDNAEKQKKYRDRERDRKTKHGSRVIKLEVYRGTQEDIAYLMAKRGLDDERELLTLMIKDEAEAEREAECVIPVIKPIDFML